MAACICNEMWGFESPPPVSTTKIKCCLGFMAKDFDVYEKFRSTYQIEEVLFAIGVK